MFIEALCERYMMREDLQFGVGGNLTDLQLWCVLLEDTFAVELEFSG
jgi:hypothetical protein